MRTRILTISLIAIAFTSLAQATGKIYIKGVAFRPSEGVPPAAFFKPYKFTLSDSAKMYLNDFGRIYKDSVLRASSYTLTLDPASSARENEAKKNIGSRRAENISNYLRNKFGIKIYRTTLMERKRPT